MSIPADFAHAICDVLTEECGLTDWVRGDLLYHLAHYQLTEFRFQGDLGFGGKLWDNWGRWCVSCYREDETPVRLAAITKANERLADLRGRYDAGLRANDA